MDKANEMRPMYHRLPEVVDLLISIYPHIEKLDNFFKCKLRGSFQVLHILTNTIATGAKLILLLINEAPHPPVPRRCTSTFLVLFPNTSDAFEIKFLFRCML